MQQASRGRSGKQQQKAEIEFTKPGGSGALAAVAASCFLNFLDLCFFFLSPPSVAAAAADSASLLALSLHRGGLKCGPQVW